VFISFKDIFVVVAAAILWRCSPCSSIAASSARPCEPQRRIVDASQLMGININRTIAATFFIGAVLAGAGGIIWGLYFNTITYNLGFRTGLVAFTSAVFGGIGKHSGRSPGWDGHRPDGGVQ